MAIKITQIKPEGAQKSAPSAKDYSGEKKGISGSAVGGRSGRIQITKIPGAEKQRSIAASRKTTRETERADELDKQTTPSASRQASKQTFGQRVLKGIESGLVSEGANLANLGGVATDRRGGTEMSGVYRRQAETLDKQIAALEKTLKDPTMTAQDIKETNEALAIARSEREKYGKVVESGEKTASSLYDTADKGYSFAQKLSEESTAGTKGIKKGALSIVPAATQIGLQTAERMVAPGMDVAGRALSVAGGNAADYRRKAGEQYDAEKATLRATVSALGVAAGGALSKGVNAAGLKLLRAAGKQNYVLPNIALGGASAVGYAAGETGVSELSKAMTDEDYAPDWKTIGETALTAFAFGAISSAINAAAITGRNKKYMNELNDAAKERYDYAKRIIEDPRATAEQKAAGAQSVMDAVDKMRYTLDDLQVVGAQKEVDAMREFLLSIYGEMFPYTGTSAGGIGTGASGLAPVTPVGGSIAPVQTGGGMSAMQENAPTAPISPRAPGAAAVMQNSTPAAAPTVGQQNTMPAQPAPTSESVQGTGGGNLTPAQPNAAQGAAEGKADALDAGKRVALDKYTTQENVQQVAQKINDGTLAVDAEHNIYRVNEDQHIDRRDSASVGERSVNAFQFDHPELHSYYADAAAVLQEEMSFAQKGGELIRRTSREAGDDEYIRTKRGVSERIARLLDDEGVRYDDIDRSLSAIIHNHGQENFAAAKRVELLLDDMLTNGYTDIHGQRIAPNEAYIAAKKAIPGADMSERTHEELPIYDMPEGQNGGIYGRQEENAGGLEPAEGAGQRADAVAAENDLYGGDRGRRPSEPGAGGAGELRSTTAEGRRRNRELTQRRREIAWEQPLTSAAALGVQGGTSDETLHVLPEESWDDELRGFSDWARGKGVKRVTMVTGLLQVETENGPVGVRGIINRESGEMVLRVDGEKRTASEIGKHEVGHLITEEENVRAFMETVRGGADWHGIYEVYERCYEPLTNGYVGMTAEERELYVWEEIMEDAYAGIDSYGQRASRYHEQAVDAIERAAEAVEHPASEPEGLTLRAVDEVKSRGPPEKYSYAGRNAENADLNALHEAERYEMQGVDAETIRQKTGWFRGADGKWRWEIDDSGTETDTKWNFLRNPDAKRYNELFEKAYLYDTATAEDLNELQILDKNLKGVRKSPLYLDEIVKHDKLFEAYPALRDVKVRFEANTGNKEGSYHPEENKFILRTGLKLEPEKLKNTLIHEIQHAIQEQEGFARGANPGYWDEMIQRGYSRRKNDGRIERARKEYHRIFDSAPEEFKDKVRRINRARLDGDYDAAETVIDELYDSEYADLWSQLDMAEFEWRSDRGEELNAYDLYRDTAGEIEARDAAARRGLTAEERRGRKPDTGDENTVFADGGVSYSIANTRDMPWKDQVRGYFSNDGTIKSSDSLYLGESSVEGVDNAPMYIPTSVITKAIRPPKGSRSAHALSQKNILNLQEGIKNAPVVIDNPARNSIVYVTADQDSAGNYIIAALDKSNDLYGETAHKVTSIHGRENIAAMLEKLGDDATIFVKNENKLNRMLPGNQILKSLALRAKVELDDNSVSGRGENVKSPTLGDEIRRQIMGEETEPFKTGESSAKDVDTGGAASSAESVSENGGNVKPKTRYSVEDETDSAGRELTAQQREYFKDSKARDEQGRLLTLYHGTTAYGEFTKFRRGRSGWLGPGIYLTSDLSYAERYANSMGEGNGHLYKLYANAINPLVVHDGNPVPEILFAAYGRNSVYKNRSAKQSNDAMIITAADIKKLREKGYDGIRWDFGKSTELSVFSPEQIKNVSNETPTDDPDIRFSAEDEDGGRYLTGLDDRSIEERKKSISLDEAINELYRQKGLSYRFYSSDDPMSRAGYAMFADEPDRVGSGYGGDEKRAFSVEESSLTDISDIKEKIIEARHNTDENTPWELEDYEDVSDDSFAELFDPEDIVDSAAAYDDESLVSWLWNNVLEPNDIAGVKTSDGAVAFSPDIIKRNLAAEIAFGRSNGDDVKFSAEGDGGEWDKELARMPQSVQEAVRRVKDERSKKPNMQEFPNLDAYLSGRSAQQAAEKAERLRDKGKDEFKGTEALEKLGVKIENSAGDYSNVEQLIANDRAAKTIQRETRKAIKRLGATPKEQNFALNIASGLYDEADIPATMNRGKVVELADYYSAEQSMSTDFIRQRRAEINENLQEKMKDLFDEHFDGEFTKEKSGKGISPESGFALYHRTPQRSMRAIFGWKRGEKINEAIFEPVYVNEQERKRFVNRMHDEVRTFRGEDGKEDALTQRERALAQLSIEGKAVEEMVGKSEIKQQIIHAAENLLDGAEMKDTAQEFGLHGKEERELAQRYADWLETKRELESGEVDRVRVENAAAKYSGLYNEFYAAINDFLVAHGYEPIGFIKGYAPHFQPEAESGKLERALKAIGVDLGAEVGKLPASIAGLTKEFKPNKRYNPFFQHRNGKSTDYDIQKGFEKYVDYLSDVLYHTDDIMRTRAASKYFRKKYAPDEISAQIQQAEDLKFATAEEKELFLKTNGIIDSSAKMSYQAMNQAMEKYTDSLFDDVTQTTKYGDLVTWLDDYANKLAGKQLFNDRSMEREVGRMSLNVGRKLVSTFARANVAGNLSSALNQTAQLPMIAGELGPKYVAEAIGDIASGKAKGDFADRSDFLTEKRGIRYLTSTKGDKFTAALFWPLERMDYLVSSIAVRGKYRKELAEGKSEKDALRAADRWGRDMMGSRSKGTAPLTFQSKNLISQMVNLFQVEALNSWEHVTQDLFGPGLREMEEKLGKKEASRRLAGIIVGTLLGAFILNRVDEELYGGTPAQFDVLGLLTGFLASGNGLSTNEQLGVWVDDVWQKMTGERLFGTDEDAGNGKFNLAAAAEDTIYNVSNDVPYVRNVSGLLGLGDQTLPMPDIYGTAKGIGSAVSDAASGDTEGFGSEIMRQLMGIAGDTLPGGRQLEKTAQGAETLARGGTYKGSGDNERLQYAVNPDFSTVLQAMLFGRNALSEARDFYAANDGGLSASQTRTYQELVDMGADREVIYDAIQKWRKIDKDDSLTDGEREAAQFELVRKLKLTNEQKERLHDDLSRSSRSYAAAQEAQKQGISAEAYAKYKDATADLTADKDENGKTINGSKKAKVLDAIDKMQLSKKQKDWLYLDAGYSEKDIGKAPWNS